MGNLRSKLRFPLHQNGWSPAGSAGFQGPDLRQQSLASRQPHVVSTLGRTASSILSSRAQYLPSGSTEAPFLRAADNGLGCGFGDADAVNSGGQDPARIARAFACRKEACGGDALQGVVTGNA
jgi:hypothetical protein